LDKIPLWVEYLAVIGFTLYAVLLAGADFAFSSLPKDTLQDLKQEHEEGQVSRVTKWLDNQEQLFATIVIGKLVMLVLTVLTAASVIFYPAGVPDVGNLPELLLQSLILACLLLLIVEWLPRFLVKRHPKWSVRFSAWTVLITFYLLWPIVMAALKTVSSGEGFFSSGRNPYWLDDELHRVLELEETHELDQEDKEMISGIIEMRDTSVREVMTPRIDMVCAEVTMNVPDLLVLIEDVGHSRIPIYKDSIDNVVGIVYAKDLLKYEDEAEDSFTVEQLARAPYFVPETKKADELLRDFQHEKTHLAMVVDEHGGIEGLVTLEDLLEEIVGEIQDEYDAELPMYEEFPDGSILVDGKLNIDELKEILQTDITPDGFDTIGGLVFDVAGHVPARGETVDFGNLRLVVREVDGQRIAKIAITKTEPPVTESEGEEA